MEQRLQSRITELEEQLQSTEGRRQAVVEQVIVAEKTIATLQETNERLKQRVGRKQLSMSVGAELLVGGIGRSVLLL